MIAGIEKSTERNSNSLQKYVGGRMGQFDQGNNCP